ncbi:TolC family protein [candidate division KSB1 bacterium]|nr:TolC family protein [candidate division KSB1 bacterium]
MPANIRHILLFKIFFLLPLFLHAQSSVKVKAATMIDNLYQLPPLELVLQHAKKNSPVLITQDALIDKRAFEVKSAKKEWITGINISLGTQFGSYGNSVLDQINIGYKGGLSINLSLYEILNRNNHVKVFEQNLIIAQGEKDELRQKLKEGVISQYNRLLLLHELVQIRNEAKETALMNQLAAEKEFLAGELLISELASVNQITAKARVEFESTRMELQNQIMQLEELAGVKFSEMQDEK